jgi:drug/metabolite transporter (DMT)-like permease
VTFGALFRAERPGLMELLGGCLVVAGVFLVVTSAARMAARAPAAAVQPVDV